MSFSCVILAAGQSKRMGAPKLSLLWNENQTFLEKILHEYTLFGCNNIICVANENNKKIIDGKVNIAVNKNLHWERFHSVKLGLEKVEEAYCFIQPVDNPFINISILETIWNQKGKADYIVPSYQNRGGHPILINQKIMEHIINLPQKDANLRNVLNNFTRKNIIMANDFVLKNIDTPEQYTANIKK